MSERDPRAFLPPMLAWTEPRPFDDSQWRYEVKWDGYRALIHTTGGLNVYSRTGQNLLDWYPRLAQLNQVLPPSLILDGEVVAMGEGKPDFYALQATSRREPVMVVVFDCLYAEQWLLDRPLSERLEWLADRVPQSGLVVHSWGKNGCGTRLLEAVAARGLEGVMAKDLHSLYLPGRRVKSWRKFLNRQTGQFVVDRAVRGKDGAWYWEVRGGPEPYSLAKARIRAPKGWRLPVTDENAIPVQPSLAVTIAFREWTPEGKLRHPVLSAWEVKPQHADGSPSR